eukprot:3807095-Pleurochrysis_carterae.AAC.1
MFRSMGCLDLRSFARSISGLGSFGNLWASGGGVALGSGCFGGTGACAGSRFVRTGRAHSEGRERSRIASVR